MRNLWKKVILCIMCVCILDLILPVSVWAEEKNEKSVEYLENGDYIEITIFNNENVIADKYISILSKDKTLTKTKVATYKNSAGNIIWSLSVTGTFLYDGKISKCTKCSYSVEIIAKNWNVKNTQAFKTANKATAKGEFTQLDTSTIIRKTVTLQCSPTGKVS